MMELTQQMNAIILYLDKNSEAGELVFGPLQLDVDAAVTIGGGGGGKLVGGEEFPPFGNNFPFALPFLLCLWFDEFEPEFEQDIVEDDECEFSAEK